MRKARCDPSLGRLGLGFLLLPLERLLELVRADRAHEREDLAETARMATCIVEAQPPERLRELPAGEDAFLDEVLAQRPNSRRLAQEPAERVDEIDRAEP